MPESKKLSELIQELVITNIKRQMTGNSDEYDQYLFDIMTTKQEIDSYFRKIDQKFEELRCVTPGPVRNLDNMLKELVDKKFEELRCECGKVEIEKEIVVVSGNSHEDLFTKTYIIPPEIKNKKGESKIRTYSTNSVESCCLKRGIEFTYYDGKLITIGCLEHRYESYSSKNP